MAIKRNRETATVHTKVENKHGKYEKDWFTIKDKTDTEPVELSGIKHAARVQVKGGVTKNMDNFESIRVDVSVELPCAPTPAAVDKAYKAASDMVDKFIVDELERAMN